MGTNNPDSKAPERIWVMNDWPNSDGLVSCCAVETFVHEVEYTRTDAITPQQAAKVLLEKGDKSMFPLFMKEYLKALSESKDGD